MSDLPEAYSGHEVPAAVQGKMYYVGYVLLAAAVSNTGAIGCITALTLPSPEVLQAEIRLCKQLTTSHLGSTSPTAYYEISKL